MFQAFAVRLYKTCFIASMFLVDIYCLGVKDSFSVRLVGLEELQDRLHSSDAIAVAPSYALRFIQGAMEYVRSPGFAPHANTYEWLEIFWNTDPAECQEEFVYGYEGKPYYIGDPNDSIEKQTLVVDTLSKLGESNYLYASFLDHFAESKFVKLLGEVDEYDFDQDDFYEGDFYEEDLDEEDHDFNVVEGTTLRSEPAN